MKDKKKNNEISKTFFSYDILMIYLRINVCNTDRIYLID